MKKVFLNRTFAEVVAIIGVLAAVGVVAFNGFIHNAKVNSAKSNHISVVKFTQTTFKKCELWR